MNPPIGMTNSKLKMYSQQSFIFWLVSLGFVLFQFFIQLSSGVVVSSMMQDLAMTASEAGLLSSAYYYVYTTLQVPVGVLFDKKNTRNLLTSNALLCSIGCFLFAISQTFTQLMMTRLMIGMGSAFAFIGLSHVLRQHYELKAFGFMIGLSETLAFLVTVIFMIVMGTTQKPINWRYLMEMLSLIGLVVTILLFAIVPNHSPQQHTDHSIRKELIALCLNPVAWINGMFIGLGFSLITVFGAMWAIPFIQLKLGCSLQQASIIDALLFLGTGLSCPVFGMIETRFQTRRCTLFLSYSLTAVLLLGVLFIPVSSAWVLGTLFGILGLTSGAYMLGYTIANEISPPQAHSTSTGFANTLAMLTAPLLQPVVGYWLDLNKTQVDYTLSDYQSALLLIPGCILLGACCVPFLPSKPTPIEA